MKRNKIVFLLLMLLVSPVCTKPMYSLSWPGAKMSWVQSFLIVSGFLYKYNKPTSHANLKSMVDLNVANVNNLWSKHFAKVEEAKNKAEPIVKDLSEEEISEKRKCYIFLQNQLSEKKEIALDPKYSKDNFYRDVVQIEKTIEHPLCKEISSTSRTELLGIISVEDQVIKLKDLYSEAILEDKKHQEKEKAKTDQQEQEKVLVQGKKENVSLQDSFTNNNSFFSYGQNKNDISTILLLDKRPADYILPCGILFCAISAIIAIGYVFKKKIEDKLLPINNASTPENQNAKSIEAKQITDLINTLQGENGVDDLYRRINGLYQGIIEQEAK